MPNKFKPFYYPDLFLTQKLQQKLRKRQKPNASQYCIAKYFPKHYQKLETSSRPILRIFKKMQQVKILHHLKMENYNVIEKKLIPLLKRLLQNKRKNMKSIPIINFYQSRSRELEIHQSLELGIFLPRIKNLNLSSKWNYGWLKHENQLQDPESKVWRFYKRFWLACRHLESVKMFEHDYDLPLLVREINKHKKVLPSLKVKDFALIFETSFDSKQLLEIREKVENLSPNLSSLMNLNEENFVSFAPLLISLLLSFSDFNVPIRTNQGERAYVNILQHEGTLTLKIRRPEVFFNQQTFPKSFQKMSQTISRYEKMRPKQLRALEFQFDDISVSNEDFLASLLKEALDIESLVLKFSFAPPGYSYLELSTALNALSNFKSLKHLTILDENESHQRLSLNLKNFPEKILSISKLTSLNINFLVQETSFSKDFLSVFLAESIEPKSIRCSKLSFSSFQSLREFFQTLNNYECLTEQNTKFKAHLRLNRIEDVFRDCESCLSLRKKIPIELTIDTRAGSTVRADLFKEIMEFLQKRFPQFKVTNNLLSDIFLLEI